jgi:hypothetical protein
MSRAKLADTRPRPEAPALDPPANPPRATGPGKVGSGPVQPEGELNGPKGPEPTRYGDWEKGGRCSDF